MRFPNHESILFDALENFTAKYEIGYFCTSNL